MIKNLHSKINRFFSIEKRYLIAFFCLIPVFAVIGGLLSSHFVIFAILFFILYVIGMFHLVFDRLEEGEAVEAFPKARKFPMANIVVHSLYQGLFVGMLIEANLFA